MFFYFFHEGGCSLVIFYLINITILIGPPSLKNRGLKGVAERDRALVFAKMWCLNIGAKIYEMDNDSFT